MSNMWSHEEIDAMRSRISQLKATVDAQDEKERELQAQLAAVTKELEDEESFHATAAKSLEYHRKLNEQLRTENASLREALISTGRNMGCLLADEVSTEFLMHLPEETKLRFAALKERP